MSVNSITLFGCAVKGHPTKELIQQCNLEALKSGYIIEPECCTEDVLEFFKNWTANYDSTFYKTWQDMKSKSREEILWDQIFHYMTTIWVGYEWGYGLIPNNHEYTETPECFKELKVVKAVSMSELLDRCLELDKSGIALSNEVVDFIANIFAQCHLEGCKEEDIIGFTNKELRAKLFAAYDIIPLDAFDILRYIATKTLGNAMIIQNRESIQKIKIAQKDANKRFDFSRLDDKRLVALSSIFLRYKNWILAFKDDKTTPNNSAINKLRRLAKAYHKPMQVGFWEDILAKKPSLEIVIANLNTLSIWKRVKIMQACKERIAKSQYKSYLIRNQKLWYTENTPEEDVKYYEALYLILKTTVPKKKVRLPKNIILAAPSSEKSFIGNYPLGSKFRFDNSAFAGMYWRRGWGQIYDVHYFTNEPFSNGGGRRYDQRHIGWNSSFKLSDDSIMFSGDVCSPSPDATDVMLVKKSAPAGYFTINYYSMYWDRESEKRCDFILGYGNENSTRMVNPADIVFRIPLEFTQPQKIVGYFENGEFTLGMFDVPGGMVPTFQEGLSKTLQARCQSYVPLSDLVEVVPDDYEGDDFVDLSGEIDKDTIIKLLSE